MTFLERNMPQLLKGVNEEQGTIMKGVAHQAKAFQAYVEKAGIICKFEWRTRESDRESRP